MNYSRVVFFFVVIASLFLVKALFAFNFVFSSGHILIYTDECAYGSFDFSSVYGLANLSVYTMIPFFFGRNAGILFNCFLSSAIVVPFFFVFREKWSERVSAFASVAIVLAFAPLWVYSFLDMTEVTLFFSLACVFLLLPRNKHIAFLPALVKPLGFASFLSLFKVLGVGWREASVPTNF